MNKKFWLAAALLAFTFMQSEAKPATPKPITYTQPDGSTIEMRLCGDEFYHYYVTLDGEHITKCDDGFFRYTTLDSNNKPVAGSIKVGESMTYSLTADQERIAKSHQALHVERRQLKTKASQARRAPMRQIAQNAKASDGEVKGLILLVNFADKEFVTSREYIETMMNEEGYSDSYGSIGSARDYFTDQSYGAFKPTFDVVGPVTLSRNMSYYGRNNSWGSDDKADVMVSEACEIASKQGLVNMADYDLNNDSWVDLVYVIYAGYAESHGAPDETVWPHAWNIYSGAGRTVQIDGVFLDAYACSSELTDTQGTQPDGIGTFCHEYSHTLGLPDFYDIDYSGGIGMHYWSVMDAGCYAENGYVPINYNAYERSMCDWVTLNELTEPASISMPELSKDKFAAYRITAENISKQFITIETRVNEGWDKGLPGEGMMVIAIDYDQQAWFMNGPNDDPYHQRVKLIPADNQWDNYSIYGDLYPYNGNNKLTTTSKPAMRVYQTVIDKPITNITYDNGVSTFDFMGGKEISVETPVATTPGEVENNKFTAYWSPVAGATSYTLYVERCSEPEEPVIEPIALEEDFNNFTADASVDVSTSLDDYTATTGWSGSKVFCNNGEVKLGSSSQNGVLKTPAFNASPEHIVYFDVYLYNESAQSGTLTFTEETGTGTGTAEIPMSDLPLDEKKTIGIRCTSGSVGTTITLECNKRLYLDNLRIENNVSDSKPRADIMVNAQIVNQKSNMQKAPIVSETRTIEGITENQYTVTEVETPVTPGIYRYKVKAVNGNGESYWSNVIEFDINDYTGVESQTVDAGKVYASNGVIYISNAQEAPVAIYNIQGGGVAQFEAGNNLVTYRPATAGLYIVRCGNKATKVLVK